MYLLDTDTCILITRGGPILDRLKQQGVDEVWISILTVYELEVGVRKATLHPVQKRRALDDFLAMFAIAGFGMAEAREAAKIRAELEKAGTPIGATDYLIAGIARSHGWTLVTGNLHEFRRVKHLKSEQWHA